MKLSEMSWKDVSDYLETCRALIIPVGTCEQHGLHLPLSTDTLVAEAFAERISEATGVALAPTVAYGVNLPCDRFVPGTAGFSFDALRMLITDLLEDWERQGFRQFFIVTAHGCAENGACGNSADSCPVCMQLAHAVVDRGDRLCHIAQTRVRKMQNIEDRHVSTRVLSCSLNNDS